MHDKISYNGRWAKKLEIFLSLDRWVILSRERCGRTSLGKRKCLFVDEIIGWSYDFEGKEGLY